MTAAAADTPPGGPTAGEHATHAKAWDQLPGEPGQAFLAFQTYLGLGPSRSLDAAYRATPGHKQGARAPGNWRTWNKTHRWPARAEAFDLRNVGVADQARVDTIRQHATDETKAWLDGLQDRQRATERLEHELGLALMEKAKSMLLFGLADHVQKTGPNGEVINIYTATDWNMGDAARLAKQGTELLRKANQMPLRVAEAPTADAGDGMFDTRGQLADRMPDGVVPPMPTDPDAQPELGASLLTDNPHDLVQPGQPVRPKGPGE